MMPIRAASSFSRHAARALRLAAFAERRLACRKRVTAFCSAAMKGAVVADTYCIACTTKAHYEPTLPQ